MEDEDHFTMLDAVNMCVTVIAYNCDNARAVQMMVSACCWHPPSGSLQLMMCIL